MDAVALFRSGIVISVGAIVAAVGGSEIIIVA
jgi:hypothetical protein